MWFMMIVKNGKDCEAGKAVGEEVLQAIGKFNQDLKKAGALVELSGSIRARRERASSSRAENIR